MNSRLTHFIFLAATIFGMAHLSSAQSTAITEQEYSTATWAGYQEMRKIFPRRETRVYSNYSEDKLSYYRIEVSEYLSSTNYRTTKTVEDNGKRTVEESIQLGAARYCRENSGEWRNTRCYQQPPPPLGDADETTYSVAIGKETKTYYRSAKLQKVDKTTSKTTSYITEDVLVLNKDNSVRDRSIARSVADPVKLQSIDTYKFEYGITIKPIEAPVK